MANNPNPMSQNVSRPVEFINKLTERTLQKKVTWQKGRTFFSTVISDSIKVEITADRDETGEYIFKRLVVYLSGVVDFEYSNPYSGNRLMLDVMAGANPLIAALLKLLRVISREAETGLNKAIDVLDKL